MPIRPENAGRYPVEWPEIRNRILARAHNCCERCGVRNYTLGGRTKTGHWLPAHPLGEKGLRLELPVPGDWAWCGEGLLVERLRIIRIVLTIAHLDHQPEDCPDENLLALCQRCHLAHDRPHHLQTAYYTRREGKAIGDLFSGPS
jgi:hypothetical protein